MSSKAKKYILHKNPGDGSTPPCAFFNSPAGCKNGDSCKFAHVRPSDKAAMSSNISTSSSDLSSESEDEAPPLPPVAPPVPKAKPTPKAKAKATPKVKAAPITDTDDIFAAPGEITAPKTPQSTLTPKNNKQDSKKKRKRNPETSDPFAKPKNAPSSTPILSKVEPSTPTTTPKSKKKKTKAAAVVSSFRDLNLPVASFSTPGTTTDSSAQCIPATVVAPTPPPPPKYPLPTSTPEGKKWQNAVVATRKNPKYDTTYDFDKAKELMDDSRGEKSKWFKTKPYGAWCANNPPAIAIDCEMCETKDPVTGAKNPKALCRLSVVNAVNPDEVLIDTLVKPAWPVIDYRTRINGIKKEHLDNVQFTMQHAQAFMTALCSNETVIIGHALHNDLIALQMDHHCNVDSALLFSVKDEPNATCSLKDLAMAVLKRDMPEVHDSVNDARVALLSIEGGYLDADGKPEPITRTFPVKKRGGSAELFVHRIPKGCTQEHISKMFLNHSHIKPTEVPDIVFNSDTGKTTVSFASGDHANLVFKTLEGEAKPDKTGRLQKRVYLRNGGYINIRKMTAPRKN